MNTHAFQRQSHAVLDMSSRRWKDMKIEHLLKFAERPQSMRMLHATSDMLLAPPKRVVAMLVYHVRRVA